MEAVNEDEVQMMVYKGMTHKQISAELHIRFPGTRGVSERTVRRFCERHGIHKPRGLKLDQLVKEATQEVGPLYGRRMMKGVLEARGVKVAESRIANSLQRVEPVQYEHRRNDTADRLNPSVYVALYFGHKLHVDQNEKLIQFGVTHVIARDGFSGKIVAYATMPVKNNLAIYESIFRDAVITHGLWDQLRVDHGREFYLMLYIQEHLRCNYGSPDIHPYVQSPSTENLTVERMWVEVNKRVNYPIKRILIGMEEHQNIVMTDPVTKFCVSFIACNVAYCALSTFVEAWNHHSIPGCGVPNEMHRYFNGTTSISAQSVPETSDAVDMFTAQGGSLTLHGLFGCDPLRDRQDLIQRRDQYFLSTHHSFGDIFSDIVSSDGDLLRNAILDFMRITESLQRL